MRQTSQTNAAGEAFFAAVPAGTYEVSAARPGYVSASRPAVTVSVGSRQELTFALSAVNAAAEQVAVLLDTLPQAPILKADTVAASISVIIDENQIVNLPLVSRNVHSLFLLEPGVTSAGANPRRGLTFSVHGQRVSASNYLLDGVDNNNMRVSGPVVVNSLEAIQELRMVNSSFSADSGRATGFVAHASTRRGGNSLHGALFGYLGNDALNATPSATKALREPKTAFRQVQAGYTLVGPLRSNLFGSSTFELSRLRYGANIDDLRLPTTAFIESIPEANPLRALFTSTPPIAVAPVASDPRYGEWKDVVTGAINSFFSTQRLDRVLRDGSERLIARYSLSRTEQRLPAEFWGYPALWPTDTFSAHNAVVGWTKAWTAGPVNDLRLGWGRERTNLDRPFNDRPGLSGPGAIQLPANTARLIAERENNNVIQITDIFTLRRGRSTVASGFELRRYLSNGINGGIESAAFNATLIAGAGAYTFSSLNDVALGRVSAFSIATDAFSPQLRVADLARRYRSTDLGAFVQHDLKLMRHLSVNMGLRWEYFGVIHDVDPSTDYNFYPGPGGTPQERLANGALRSTDQNPDDFKNRIYRPDYLNLAPSFGFAWDPFGTGKTVVRAGYAIGFDRFFDGARDVRKNRTRAVFCVGIDCAPLTIPASEALPAIQPNRGRPATVIVDENVRTPYAQNWYVGVQRNVTKDMIIALGHAGSVGRKLLSRDIVNRAESGIAPSGTANDLFISNQGGSTYLGMELGIRGRTKPGLRWQLSYTWSHAIDNQSDILEGTRVGPDLTDSVVATFTRALDPRVDRASANFDQRHNVMFNAIWDLPSAGGRLRYPLSGWTVSTIAGYHSGFPLTVVGLTSGAGLRNNRPDIAGALTQTHEPVEGGVRWLTGRDFIVARDRVGNLGRNAIAGPGAWSCDLAVVKTLPFAGDAVRAQLRFEAYNVFNHANLGVPATRLGAPDFGITYAGRSRSYYSRFGELPLDSPSRRLQFALRLQF